MTKTEGVMKDLRPQDITTNGNVRTTTSKEIDKELLNSVRDHGVIEPVIVRKDGSKIILIAGHRRLAAARAAKLTKIPVRILNVDADEAIEIQIIENLQRRDLTPLEEAEAYKVLIDRIDGKPVWDHKGKKIVPNAEFFKRVSLVAKSVSKTATYIIRVLRLTELPQQIKVWIGKGKLTAMHGALLVDLPENIRGTVIKNFLIDRLARLKDGDVFPISDLKYHIESTYARNLKLAPFPTAIEFAGEVACTECPYNSGNAMSLFNTNELGSCRQTKCWNKKKDQVYRDIKAKYMKADPILKKLRFAGYAKIVEPYNEKPRLPYRIKQKLVLRVNATQIKLIGKNFDLFGWAIIKPTKDSKRPDTQIVYVSLEDSEVAMLLGIKIKKVEPKSDSNDNFRRHSFIQKEIDKAVGEAKNAALSVMKKRTAYFYILASTSYNDDTNAWKEMAKLLDVKLGKATKDNHPVESLDLAALATMMVGVQVMTSWNGPALIGIDREKISRIVEPEANIAYDTLVKAEVAKAAKEKLKNKENKS